MNLDNAQRKHSSFFFFRRGIKKKKTGLSTSWASRMGEKKKGTIKVNKERKTMTQVRKRKKGRRCISNR